MDLKILIIYIVALIVFLIIDFVWLGIIARDLYANTIGHLMTDKINFLAAFLFYLIFIAGLVVFVINPGLAGGSIMKMLPRALFFGLVTYATYDLTNQATLRDWPVKVTLIDLVWGMFISGSVSTITYYILKYFKLC
jgi:uncharacterized membrane protein